MMSKRVPRPIPMYIVWSFLVGGAAPLPVLGGAKPPVMPGPRSYDVFEASSAVR